MKDSTKNQSNLGNKNLNQTNQKPIQTPPRQEEVDRKFNKSPDAKHPEKNSVKQPTQQDRTSKR